jgi:hypothetical protein
LTAKEGRNFAWGKMKAMEREVKEDQYDEWDPQVNVL